MTPEREHEIWERIFIASLTGAAVDPGLLTATASDQFKPTIKRAELFADKRLEIIKERVDAVQRKAVGTSRKP